MTLGHHRPPQRPNICRRAATPSCLTLCFGLTHTNEHRLRYCWTILAGLGSRIASSCVNSLSCEVRTRIEVTLVQSASQDSKRTGSRLCGHQMMLISRNISCAVPSPASALTNPQPTRLNVPACFQCGCGRGIPATLGIQLSAFALALSCFSRYRALVRDSGSSVKRSGFRSS